MKKLAIFLGIPVVILFLGSLFLPALAWVGETNIEIRFQVLESGNTTRPIKEAKIRVVRETQLYMLSETNFAEQFSSIVTDNQGQATLRVMCGAGGSRGFLFNRGRYVVSHELSVEALGYRTASCSLANVLGGRRWPLKKKVFDVQLYLIKNP